MITLIVLCAPPPNPLPPLLEVNGESFLEVKDLGLAREKHEDSALRQVLVDLYHLGKSLLNVVLLGGLREVGRHWVLSCVYFDEIRRFLEQILGEQALIFSEVRHSKGCRHNDQSERKNIKNPLLPLLVSDLASCMGYSCEQTYEDV